MKSFTDKFLIPLFIAIIMFVIGYGVTLYKESNSSKKRYIDAGELITFNELDSTELGDHKIQILYNGNPINSTAAVDVELFNYSDKDFRDIKVAIEICPEKGDSLQLVQYEVLGAHNSKNGIIKLLDSCKGGIGNSMYFEYQIEVANRADTITDKIFDINYGLISKKKPSVNVRITGVGVEKQKYDYSHFQSYSWLESDTALIVFIILGYALLIYILVKTTSYFRRKRNKREKEFLMKNLSEQITNGELKYDAENIINTFYHLYNKFDYEDTTPWIRQIKRMKPPNKETP